MHAPRHASWNLSWNLLWTLLTERWAAARLLLNNTQQVSHLLNKGFSLVTASERRAVHSISSINSSVTWLSILATHREIDYRVRGIASHSEALPFWLLGGLDRKPKLVYRQFRALLSNFKTNVKMVIDYGGRQKMKEICIIDFRCFKRNHFSLNAFSKFQAFQFSFVLDDLTR